MLSHQRSSNVGQKVRWHPSFQGANLFPLVCCCIVLKRLVIRVKIKIFYLLRTHCSGCTMRQTSYIILFGRNCDLLHFKSFFFFFLQIYNIYWGQCVSVGFASTLGGSGRSDLETRMLKHGTGWVGLFCSASRKIFSKANFCEEIKAANRATRRVG